MSVPKQKVLKGSSIPNSRSLGAQGTMLRTRIIVIWDPVVLAAPRSHEPRQQRRRLWNEAGTCAEDLQGCLLSCYGIVLTIRGQMLNIPKYGVYIYVYIYISLYISRVIIRIPCTETLDTRCLGAFDTLGNRLNRNTAAPPKPPNLRRPG